MGQEVVGEQHGLGPLEVGVAGQVGVSGRFRSRQQDVLQGDGQPGDLDELALAPQAQVGGDLVVAAAGGVQLGAGGAGELGDPALDGGVDVLVALDEAERAAGHLLLRPVERGQHGGDLVVVEQAGPREPADVGT